MGQPRASARVPAPFQGPKAETVVALSRREKDRERRDASTAGNLDSLRPGLIRIGGRDRLIRPGAGPVPPGDGHVLMAPPMMGPSGRAIRFERPASTTRYRPEKDKKSPNPLIVGLLIKLTTPTNRCLPESPSCWLFRKIRNGLKYAAPSQSAINPATRAPSSESAGFTFPNQGDSRERLHTSRPNYLSGRERRTRMISVIGQQGNTIDRNGFR